MKVENFFEMRAKTLEFLKSAVKALEPSEILEAGTYHGASALAVLESCKGKITTIEIDPERAETARKNIEKKGYKNRATVINDDAEIVFFMMQGNKYDLIIIDSAKSQYNILYELALGMLNENGVIFMDNMDFYEKVQGEEYPAHKHRTIITNLRAFKENLNNDTRVHAEYFNIEDGVYIIKHK